MVGRVTQGMINTQLLRNLNHNYSTMHNLQNKLGTGRDINKPSDDPVGLSFAMRYRSELSANEQYQENVDSALSWLDHTDSMLNQANNVLHRIRVLTVQGANGSNPDLATDAIKDEIGELYDHLVNVGNSQFNGKYVFNGQITDVPPFTAENAMNESTDDGEILFEIGVGVKIAVNVPGDRVFGGLNPDGTPQADNIFKVTQEIMTALENNDSAEVSDLLGDLDSRMNKFLEIRAEVGAKLNRIELSSSRLEDIGINLQTMQSKTEDADIPALITNLKTSKNVYQASLSVGAKIISASLVDFLR